jgi:hypothetical protein
LQDESVAVVDRGQGFDLIRQSAVAQGDAITVNAICQRHEFREDGKNNRGGQNTRHLKTAR